MQRHAENTMAVKPKTLEFLWRSEFLVGTGGLTRILEACDAGRERRSMLNGIAEMDRLSPDSLSEREAERTEDGPACMRPYLLNLTHTTPSPRVSRLSTRMSNRF